MLVGEEYDHPARGGPFLFVGYSRHGSWVMEGPQGSIICWVPTLGWRLTPKPCTATLADAAARVGGTWIGYDLDTPCGKRADIRHGPIHLFAIAGTVVEWDMRSDNIEIRCG